jgi:NAD(P)-dependent dehydrogenase (short-subunit alcohol dehydrogenase family)
MLSCSVDKVSIVIATRLGQYTYLHQSHDAYDKYPQIIQQIVDKTALGRLGDASDVGVAIAALLSDDFRWVTGQSIEASGGARMAMAS